MSDDAPTYAIFALLAIAVVPVCIVHVIALMFA
jgi:hypothetical protein